MFKLDETCRTFGGEMVRIVEVSGEPGYECVKGDDDKWRYNRRNDRGRCTGSRFDMDCEHNLIY